MKNLISNSWQSCDRLFKIPHIFVLKSFEIVVFVAASFSAEAGMAQSIQSDNSLSTNVSSLDALLLRQSGQISAEADNAGDGGNITLVMTILVALENIDIMANALAAVSRDHLSF